MKKFYLQYTVFGTFLALFIFFSVNKKFSVGFDFRLLVILSAFAVLFFNVLKGFYIRNRITPVLLACSLIWLVPVAAYSLNLTYTNYFAIFDQGAVIGKVASEITLVLFFFTILVNERIVTRKLVLRVFFWSLVFLNLGFFLQFAGVDIHIFTLNPQHLDAEVDSGYFIAKLLGSFRRYSSWVQSAQLPPLLTFPYLYLLLTGKEKVSPWIYLLFILPFTASLSLTFYFGMFVAFTGYLVFRKPGLWIPPIVLISVIALSIFLDSILGVLTVQTMASRYEFWGYGIDAAVKNPILGYGPKASAFVVAQEMGWDYMSIHSSYMATIVEHGVPGLIILFLMMLFPFFYFRRLPVHYMIPWILYVLYNVTNDLFSSFASVVYLVLIPLCLEKRNQIQERDLKSSTVSFTPSSSE